MMKYNNPIKLKHGNKRANAGDPFVLKYNGYYYLYVSTEANETGIRCYKSTDLINWEFQKLVCNDEITLNAYAPEVIFFKGKFILATSPSGNGHYFYTSNHPLGPFERVTDNIGNMIDGSFYKENGKLYFLRANHFGISIHEVTEDYKLINRVDLDAEMNGWTEGPFLIKRDNIYYLTYCGNNLFADTYRVDYSFSDKILGPYVKGVNNSLLNKLDSSYDCLGHSAIIKGPNLYDYYNVYHKLTKKNTGSIRDYCIDRLDFNKEILKQNITNIKLDYPSRPTYESFNHDNLDLKDGLYYTKESLTTNSLLEINIKGKQINLIIGNTKNNYYILSGNNGLYDFKEIKNGQTKTITSFKLDLCDSCFNKIEMKQIDNFEIYVNDNLVKSQEMSIQGRISIPENSIANLGYIAFNNIEENASRGLQILPNLVFSNELKKSLEQDDVLTFDVLGFGDYYVSAFMKVEKPSIIKLNNTLIKLDKNSSPYEFNNEFLTRLNINKETNLKLVIIEGKAIINHLIFEPLNLEDLSIKKADALLEETICLEKTISYSNSFKTKLEILDRNFRSRFGVLVNVTEFSDFKFQTQYSFNGYFIGFNQELLVVDRVNFGIKRIFDVPFKPKGKSCVIEAKFNRNKISVFVDGELIIECYDQHIKNTGYLGTYSNELSKIKFLDTWGGNLND